MSIEIKEIDGLPDYWATPYGEIYSTKISPRYNPNGDMRPLQPRNHPTGYQYIGCWIDTDKRSKRIWKRVHRVIWETFKGKIPKGYEVDHYNDVRNDNRLDNLQLLTRSQNMQKAYARKRALKKQNEKN